MIIGIQCEINTKQIRTRIRYLQVFLGNYLQCSSDALAENEDGDVDVWRHEEG